MRKFSQNKQLLLAPTFIGLMALIAIQHAVTLYPIHKKRYCVYRLNQPSEMDGTPNFKKFSEKSILREVKNKSITTYYLTGDLEDKKKIQIIRYEAVKMKYTNSNAVIRIHFRDKTTYGDFVQLVDIMNQDKHARYAYFNDYFYIFGWDEDSMKKRKPREAMKELDL